MKLILPLFIICLGVLLLENAKPQERNQTTSIKEDSTKTISKVTWTQNESLPTQEQIDKIITTEGAISAWIYLKSNAENHVSGAHIIAHYIGGEIYDEEKINGISSCDSAFGFGCYHGLTERMIAVDGIKSIKGMSEVCSKPENKSIIRTCYHGLGHALLTHNTGELNHALKSCDDLVDISLYKENCYSGVMMEFSINNDEDPRDHELLWPCIDLKTEYKSMCFLYQHLILARKLSNDYEAMFTACDKSGYGDICTRGIANQVGQHNMQNSDEVIRVCNLAPEKYKYDCIIYAAEQYVFYKIPIEQTKNALCNSMPDTWRVKCVNTISRTES